ncbi:MAG: cyclic nucleotide-binding domain-containing protein [Actinobacteria bacterium]|nr:cyclic nucleotide-binding domain-containing protein [Actinomycetota bacterium]
MIDQDLTIGQPAGHQDVVVVDTARDLVQRTHAEDVHLDFDVAAGVNNVLARTGVPPRIALTGRPEKQYTAPVREFGTELTEQERADLVRHSRPCRLPAGTSLFVEGARSDTVVIVVSGAMKVFSSAEDGTEVILAVRGPGALLGELAAIDGQPSSASVTSLESVEVLTMRLQDFTTFLQAHPQIMWLLLRIQTDRLRDADRKRIEFGVYDSLTRVARRLIELEGYAKPSLKKCRPIAARNEDKKVFSGRL